MQCFHRIAMVAANSSVLKLRARLEPNARICIMAMQDDQIQEVGPKLTHLSQLWF